MSSDPMALTPLGGVLGDKPTCFILRDEDGNRLANISYKMRYDGDTGEPEGRLQISFPDSMTFHDLRQLKGHTSMEVRGMATPSQGGTDD